jgi:protein ImuB
MLWIALTLPELSVQIAERICETSHPLVIASGPDNRPCVFAANQAAQLTGIHAGMAIASARTLANDLRVMPRQLHSERDALHNFACWASQFTPYVSLKPDQSVLLEVASTLRLHGGLGTLLNKLRSGTDQLGYRVACGVAPSPLAAWLFAMAREQGLQVRACTDLAELTTRVAQLPLTLLDWPQETLRKLTALGIMRIADCLALPADGFSKRFGPGLWLDLQRLLGRVPDPRAYFAVPETYRARTEFGFEVNDAMALLFPLKRLLAEMEGFLRGRGAGLLECRLLLEHGHQQCSTVAIRVAKPERSTDRLIALAREHLSQAQLPATVLALGLQVDRLVPLTETSASWLPNPNQQADGWFQLLDKLSARLGSDNVYRLQAVEEHRPEQAWKAVGVSEAWKKPTQQHYAQTLRPRPLFLLPSPRKLLLEDDTPLCHGKIDLLAGPERIETGWWDGLPVQRDYYVGRNPYGETLWLYRDLQHAGSWHLHGVFA